MTLTGIVKSAGAAALLTIMALGLAGCGRRSDLGVPGASAANGAVTPSGTSGTGIGGTSAEAKSSTKPVAPKRDFLLDPLL